MLGAIVHSARSTDVVHVLIDGRPVLKDRRLLTLDAHEVAENARKQGELADRAATWARQQEQLARQQREAARRARVFRLTGATVYSTIEPCAMCAGALVQARVRRLVYGARDERAGAVESVFRVCDNDSLNHRIELTAGVLESECRELMQQFFRARRVRANDE